jgi:hypothetical protein
MFGLFMQQMRLRPVRRLPIAFGWLTKRGDAVPGARLVEVEDSYTLIPLDQPARFAAVIREFTQR